MKFNRQDHVRCWFDDNMGGTWVHGVVIAAGPKTFRVRWESGLTNRFRHDTSRVEHLPERLKSQTRELVALEAS